MINYSQMENLFQLNTPYEFTAYNKKWENRVQIKLIITKVTNSYIHYCYNENSWPGNYYKIEDMTKYKNSLFHQPFIYAKSKIKKGSFIPNQSLSFTITNRNYQYYKLYVMFMKDIHHNLNHKAYLRRLLYSTCHFRSPLTINNCDFPVIVINRNHIRRYVTNLRKRLNAKKVIVKYWCRARYNPEYKIGRRYAMDNYYQDILGIPPPPNKPLPPIPV
jgi:hypothetical protein